MDIKKVITNLIKSLQDQGYSFEESLHASAFEESFGYQSGIKKMASNLLQSITKNLVSYDHIDKAAFVRDYKRFQQNIDDRMLFTYAYKSGALSIVGIIYADDLSINELKSIFNKLDDGVTNVMKAHVGQANGQDAGTYGTMLLVFENTNKARNFNSSIRNYFSSHFMASTYISTITVDCQSSTLTQGKAGLFGKWQGGMDVSTLKNKLFV